LIDGPGGTSFAVVNHAPRWSPTGLSYEWDPLDGGGHGNRDTARVLDINGDGLPDVWVQRNTFNAPYNPADFDTTVGPFTLVDTRGLVVALNTYSGLAGCGYHAGISDILPNVGGSFKRLK